MLCVGVSDRWARGSAGRTSAERTGRRVRSLRPGGCGAPSPRPSFPPAQPFSRGFLSKGLLKAMEILGVCSWKYFRQNQAKAPARPRPRREGLTHGRADRARGPRRPEPAPGSAERGRGKGRYLRPGWLLPARIRRTRSGRPSRQLSAVDTRKICPPCTEKLRSSAGTALPAQPATGPAATAARGEVRRAQPAAGAHPLHDPAVYLHPVPVHGWR